MWEVSRRGWGVWGLGGGGPWRLLLELRLDRADDRGGGGGGDGRVRKLDILTSKGRNSACEC